MAEEKKLEDLEAKLIEAQKSIDALVAKNKELLDEKRATKSGAERQLMEAQDRIAELEGQVSKVQADAKKAEAKHAEAIKAATDTAESFRIRTHKLVRDDGLRKELVAQNVRKEYLDAAHALLREGIQVDDEKNEAFALVKDKDGKESRVALGDYVKTWASSDTGKNFVGVPVSSGGGASGGSSSTAGKSMSRAAFDSLDSAGKMAFSKDGGTLTD